MSISCRCSSCCLLGALNGAQRTTKMPTAHVEIRYVPAKNLRWVCLKMGYTPNYSHLVGIMISKTIGFRGTQHFQTNPYRCFKNWGKISPPGLVVCSTQNYWLGISTQHTKKVLKNRHHIRLETAMGCFSGCNGHVSPVGGFKMFQDVSRCFKYFAWLRFFQTYFSSLIGMMIPKKHQKTRYFFYKGIEPPVCGLVPLTNIKFPQRPDPAVCRIAGRPVQ